MTIYLKLDIIETTKEQHTTQRKDNQNRITSDNPPPLSPAPESQGFLKALNYPLQITGNPDRPAIDPRQGSQPGTGEKEMLYDIILRQDFMKSGRKIYYMSKLTREEIKAIRPDSSRYMVIESR